MTTAAEQGAQRLRDWHIGEIDHQGETIKVWQHCQEDRIMDLYPDACGVSMLTTPDGGQAVMPEFFGVLVPQGVPRSIIIDELEDGVIGITLYIPSMGVSISKASELLPR